MNKTATKPLKLRQSSTGKGLWILLILIMVSLALRLTAGMHGQAPFALAIMFGSISLGYVIGGFSLSRRPMSSLTTRVFIAGKLAEPLPGQISSGAS
jgi:hypothetical protein